MTHADAVAFWYGRINYEVKAAAPADLKLERMRSLLARLGDPHNRLRTVHVTGTKGKGSTAAMIAAVLRAAGYRVGLFTSPHLVRVEERIQVENQPITPEELAALMAEVAPAAVAMDAGPHGGPSFFEIGTAVGLLHFVRRRVELAVVEVGLGGRFDSTNVINPLVTVITSIGYDHMAQLGNTLEAIAYQKAGIFKRGIPAISGVTDPGPAGVIAGVAAELGCPLWVRGREFDFSYTDPHYVLRNPRRTYSRIEIGLLGDHQAANAAVAVAAVERLRDAGLTIPDRAVCDGLRTVRWPARVEVVSRSPAVVLDTAHNVPSVEALVNTLRRCVPVAGTKVCVFAASSDKPFADMLRVLAGYFDHFHVCQYSNNPRSVPPEKLVPLLPAGRFTAHATATEAWAAARAAAGADDLVCVTGSVFLAGELDAAVRA